MSELQPGMLALVIGAVLNPQHIGKIVTVIREAPAAWIDCCGHGFMVKGIEGCDWALTKHLLPIKPLADPLDVTHKEELHA